MPYRELASTPPHLYVRGLKSYIFVNVLAFLYVKANSKEICEKVFFPSFVRQMLMSVFLSRFKANYFEKMHGYPIFVCGFQ